MNKPRLWRVDLTHKMGYQAPSFFVETSNSENQLREKAEKEAIRLAKGRTGLGSYLESWKISVTHLEDYLLLDGVRWVKKGVYTFSEQGRVKKYR